MLRLTAAVAIVAASGGGAAAADRPATVLQPTGKWTVEYAESMCVASRPYIAAGKNLTLAIRPLPIGNSVELYLVSPGGRMAARLDAGRAVLGPNGTVLKGSYVAWSSDGGRQRITSLTIEDERHALDEAATITLSSAGSSKPITLAVPNIAGVMKAMAPCQADLLRSWKLDPDIARHAAIPAVPKTKEATWFSPGDYPMAAMHGDRYGNTTILWTIGVNGLVTSCRVVVRSGTDALDDAACATITKRARYAPALDQAGKPIPSYAMRRIAWRLS